MAMYLACPRHATNGNENIPWQLDGSPDIHEASLARNLYVFLPFVALREDAYVPAYVHS